MWKDITVIVIQKNVRSLNTSERLDESRSGRMLHWSVRASNAEIWVGENKVTESWPLENSKTNTELGFWWTRSVENISTGQTTSANAPYQRRSQSTKNMFCWWVFTSPARDMRTTTLKRCTDQQRSPRIPTRRTYRLWEATSMPNWDQGMELNVSVLERTHSKRLTREETGWSNGWCAEKRM